MSEKRTSATACTATSGRCTCGCWATLGLGRGVVCKARRNGSITTTCVRLCAHEQHDERGHRGFDADGREVQW